MISGIPTALVCEKGLIWSGRPKRPSKPAGRWRGNESPRDNPTEAESTQLATLTTGILNNKQLKRFSVALKAHGWQRAAGGKVAGCLLGAMHEIFKLSFFEKDWNSSLDKQ